MAFDKITMPTLGEADAQGVIAEIKVSEGDQIAKGDIVLEVDTDKVVIDVPSDRAGRVQKVLVGVGDKVVAGTEIINILAEQQSDEEKAEDLAHTDSVESKHRISELNAESEESRNTVHSTQNDRVNASTGGDLAIDRGGFREVQQVPQQEPSILATALNQETRIVESRKSAVGDIKAGPSVRRLSRELGVDLSMVNGSGGRNRIEKADVKAFVKDTLEHTYKDSKVTALPQKILPKMPNFDEFGAVHREATTSAQEATANNMHNSWSSIPHAWLEEKIDITELDAARKKHVSRVKSAGGNFTLTTILVKALAECLHQFPIFNAAYDQENNQIIYRDYFDIGVAVDTEKGLVVPALRDIRNKSLTEIAKDFTGLSQKAKQRKLSMQDLSGAGFTLSNLKGMSVSGILPIINWPQTAILGAASSDWQPVFDAKKGLDQFEARMILPVTLGFDHRVINGADGARFLGALKNLLEDPFTLLL